MSCETNNPLQVSAKVSLKATWLTRTPPPSLPSAIRRPAQPPPCMTSHAAAAASSSRYHVMTPDLNFAEIGHGRGARGTSDAGSVGGSTTTLRGYDMQTEARSSTLTFPIPRRGYTMDHQMYGQQPSNLSNPYHQHHPMERESATARNAHRSQRQRQREWEPSDNRGMSVSPTTRELQESVQSALGGGRNVGGYQNSAANADGSGRAGRRGWRNTLSAAEQYASSLLFGGRGGAGAAHQEG